MNKSRAGQTEALRNTGPESLIQHAGDTIYGKETANACMAAACLAQASSILGFLNGSGSDGSGDGQARVSFPPLVAVVGETGDLLMHVSNTLTSIAQELGVHNKQQ